MRTGQPIIGRPAWYDRNPVQKVNNYNATLVTPHSITERWSYTVPSGKKAMVEILEAEVLRAQAASTVGLAEALIALTPSGGSEKSVLCARIFDNTVAARSTQAIGSALLLLADDKLTGKTVDTSTGGSCDYYLAYKITEFDA
jgi:hypothetical protein